MPNCNHTGKFEVLYGCQQLSLRDVKKFFDLFYSKAEKPFQDEILARNMVTNNVERRRVLDVDVKRSPSSYKVRYYVTNCKQKKIPVCLAAFLRIVCVTRARMSIRLGK